MKRMTYEEFKNKYVEDKGFSDWAAFDRFCRRNNWPTLIETIEKVAQLYSTYCSQQAFEEGCEAQKKICAKNARMTHHCGHRKQDNVIRYHQVGADNVQVNKDSILSSKNAPNPHTPSKDT
jgi:hypothetical protein